MYFPKWEFKKKLFLEYNLNIFEGNFCIWKFLIVKKIRCLFICFVFCFLFFLLFLFVFLFYWHFSFLFFFIYFFIFFIYFSYLFLILFFSAFLWDFLFFYSFHLFLFVSLFYSFHFFLFASFFFIRFTFFLFVPLFFIRLPFSNSKIDRFSKNYSTLKKRKIRGFLLWTSIILRASSKKPFTIFFWEFFHYTTN